MHWGEVSLRMATVFGITRCIKTMSAVLSLQVNHPSNSFFEKTAYGTIPLLLFLQESEFSPRDNVRAAFVALFFKRVG